jgi:RNA polymerase sigma factor (sigma-70 family)
MELLLESFDGEQTLKSLFWELLGYDRVRDPLPLSILPPSANEYMTNLEVFADSAACRIVLAQAAYFPDGGRLEQMIWAVHREIGTCMVVLTDGPVWHIVYPDETLKPRVRILPLPGAKHERTEVLKGLIGLSAEDEYSGEKFTSLELENELNQAFPGPTPNIGNRFTDFAWVEQHESLEVRDLLPVMRLAARYPLLTEAQERGDDLTGNEKAPDGSELPFQQWRLVTHNLRLVIWLAFKVPRFGITLEELVQEGCMGLMTAVRRFDPARGNRFSTYAIWWIRQNMYREMHNKCNLIRWPVYRATKLFPALLKNDLRDLEPGEKPVQSIDGRLHRRLSNLSLSRGDILDAPMLAQARHEISEALLELKSKQRIAIERRFGLNDGEEETLESIGQGMNLTRERVRQREAQVLGKFRHPAYRALRLHHEALDWRGRRKLAEGCVYAQPPFCDFVQSLTTTRAED